MPAGVTWGQYISFSIAAMLSMLAGSQVVHLYYKPLQDLNEYINRELKNLPDNIQVQIKDDLSKDGILK
ncbi:uncharacterized protein C12orf73 homolog [Bombyx mandarina]|uniref:Uncharacterized protein n=2 Tax=Bombyx TaxID=7090 RepID=A0A8R2DJR4_BOMMO|nr:protein brawnin [Bombyx mori]XP_028031894.1 uncharacterized protein C12orf73 homolog [Bombyx mandarina]